MPDDVPTIIQEIMDLTGDKQVPLAKRLRVAQSTLNRWLHGGHIPNKKQWDRIQAAWREAMGIKLTIDQKIEPYDIETQLVIHQMVDNYLRTLPRPHK